MALTLVEAAKLSNDQLKVGVIDTITTESLTMQLLPFIPILGNGLTYNRLNVAPTAAFYDPGDVWTEDTPTFTQATAALKILGGDSDVDNFLKATRSNIQDLEAETLIQKARAVRRKFEATFINGNTATGPKEFEGIDRLTVAGQSLSMGINGATLSLAKLDEMIDLIRGGPASALIMSRRTRRSLEILIRASGTLMLLSQDAFGGRVGTYAGLPIAIDDNISDAQTVGTSVDCSTVYCVRFDPADGLCGIASEQIQGDPTSIINVETVGQLETKDATRHRVKMYAATVLFSNTAIAKLTGVRP